MNDMIYYLSLWLFRLQDTIVNAVAEKKELAEASLGDQFRSWLTEKGMTENYASILEIIISLTAILILCIIANFITKKLLIAIISRLVRKSKTKWDDILLEKKVFNRVAHFAPAIVIYYLVEYSLAGHPDWISVIQAGTYIYMIIVTLLVLDSFINALHGIYQTLEISKDRSIKGYIQVVKIIIYFIGIILILSILLNKEVGYFFTGLGALAAVLMLVFKDSILGLVGGIQLSANDMVRPGDWITMPKFHADGTVTEITLNTVKVQNWDKTISMIPTYAMVSDSFSNWRGMEESGGRRIRRSINIDMKSVRFLDDQMINKFKKTHLLTDYIESKLEEVKKYNTEKNIDESVAINGRRMTNLGTFRKYLEAYLHYNENIHEGMTFLVRHLQPGETGLPIEVYVFSKVQAWAKYEEIQADIFDHIIAIIPEFELKVFQNPTGDDFRSLAGH